jgi:hypothetical protein
MVLSFGILVALIGLFLARTTSSPDSIYLRAPDPCATIAGNKWVAPRDVRACYESIKVDESIKSNVSSPVIIFLVAMLKPDTRLSML